MPLANTFSIVARCSRTGALGVAVASALPAVGSICPFTRAGVGAVSTQSWVHPYLAIDSLDAIARGSNAKAALAEVLAKDEAAALRQIGVVDAAGVAAAHTGAQCTPWCGHHIEPGLSIQGNMLTGPEVLEAMRQAFHQAPATELAERLLAAMVAGDAAGGDKHGKQSAALRVHGAEAYADIDLRVDEHTQAVTELARVFEVVRHQLLPLIGAMPKRGQRYHAIPAEVTAMLLRPAQERPGGTAAPPFEALAAAIGLDLPPDRLAAAIASFIDIAAEIAKLRALDLSDEHPAVVFRLPLDAFPKRSER
jgi:uncharacterized Ntn-hydrolase superfamily protein